MPICNLPCALCAACSTVPCVLLRALLYHEASRFSQSAFVCLMLLFTSMQLKFFNIASVNTQALLHPFSSPALESHLLSSYLRVVAFRPQKPVYRALQPVAGRQRQRQRHQEDFRISCQMGKVCMGVMTLCLLYVRYGIMTSSIHGNS